MPPHTHIYIYIYRERERERERERFKRKEEIWMTKEWKKENYNDKIG